MKSSMVIKYCVIFVMLCPKETIIPRSCRLPLHGAFIERNMSVKMDHSPLLDHISGTNSLRVPVASCATLHRRSQDFLWGAFFFPEKVEESSPSYDGL